jgi:hypothetical protein
MMDSFGFFICRFFFSVKRKSGGKRKAQRDDRDRNENRLSPLKFFGILR